MGAALRCSPSPSNEVEPRSFDASRERQAPNRLIGLSLAGVERTIKVTTTTLVAAIKPNCDGCSDFVHGDLKELDHVNVILVSATSGDGEWGGARREILVAPDLLNELGIRSAPYYVLIDPANSSVITEGALMSSAQVASEIERYLDA
jgi:hypothetical protein